ncbi:MAG: hypothetical protein LBO78_00020 [Rickettsiales bacterium]|nr:hypothetical protein [Rickettsiales bacterium]
MPALRVGLAEAARMVLPVVAARVLEAGFLEAAAERAAPSLADLDDCAVLALLFADAVRAVFFGAAKPAISNKVTIPAQAIKAIRNFLIFNLFSFYIIPPLE